jgi:hypothetical protein
MGVKMSFPVPVFHVRGENEDDGEDSFLGNPQIPMYNKTNNFSP